MIPLIVAGLAIGCVYALVATGFVLVYRTTGILNFTQGSFVMLSGMTASWLITNEHWAYLPADLGAVVFTIITSIVLWFAVLTPLILRRIFGAAVLATLVASYIYQDAVLRWQGPNPVFLPVIQPTFQIRLFSSNISSGQVYVVLGTLVLIVLLALFLKFTSLGRATRACASNRETAQLLGISPITVGGIAMGICALIGAVSGLLITPILPDAASGGTEIALYGFVAAVFGGFGRLTGALLGGLTIGVVQEFVTRYVSGLYVDAIVFMTLLPILLVRSVLAPGANDTE